MKDVINSIEEDAVMMQADYRKWTNKEPRVTQDGLSREEKIKRIYEVMWQNKYWELMIWDVLQRCNTKWGKFVYAIFHTLAPLWDDMSKPIDDQCSDCIDYVFSLLETTTDGVSY